MSSSLILVELVFIVLLLWAMVQPRRFLRRRVRDLERGGAAAIPGFVQDSEDLVRIKAVILLILQIVLLALVLSR